MSGAAANQVIEPQAGQIDPALWGVPTAPPWLVGNLVDIEGIALKYRGALRSVVWDSGGAFLVPAWALDLCGLSRNGRSSKLQHWIQWCAAHGREAKECSRVIMMAARTMPPAQALVAIDQIVGS